MRGFHGSVLSITTGDREYRSFSVKFDRKHESPRMRASKIRKSPRVNKTLLLNAGARQEKNVAGKHFYAKRDLL